MVAVPGSVDVTPGSGKKVATYDFTDTDSLEKQAQRVAASGYDGSDLNGLLSDAAWNNAGNPSSLIALQKAMQLALLALKAATDAVTTAVGTGTVGTGTPAVPNLTTVLSVQGQPGMTPLTNTPLPTTPVSGLTAAMTGTASTAVTGMSAPGAGKNNYITQISVSNSHATVGTDVELQDGNGGATFYVIPAAALYGGGELSFPTPLKQPTANTALYAKNTTTGASTRVSCSGFQA